ncbi:hypothetical protein LSH36_318g03043 [Paralvinella palmiformis]|uniref:Uncharacterized protein n=1 Tax=Paralvinella palmiformis TaxID=53620 RepID=A0AAD9N2N9_9ANNE|nr:hypothetical protein LSH36_318g03043 [Paralvinella palmiformis]
MIYWCGLISELDPSSWDPCNASLKAAVSMRNNGHCYTIAGHYDEPPVGSRTIDLDPQMEDVILALSLLPEYVYHVISGASHRLAV